MLVAGKLYDLLNGRKHLIAREGRNKEMCIVALSEYLVDNSPQVGGFIQHAAESRTTGSTGLLQPPPPLVTHIACPELDASYCMTHVPTFAWKCCQLSA